MAGVELQLHNATHDVSEFSCGTEPIDIWLKKHSLNAMRVNTGRTYVAVVNDKVAGYYAIAAGSLLRSDLPSTLRFEIPNHPVPLVLLARVGVDRKYQREGLGTVLVLDAIRKALMVGENVGVFCVATNAKDEMAKSFYQSMGFRSSKSDPRLMLFPLKFPVR